MTSSKKPAPDGEPRKRGRPAERFAMTPEQAIDALDRMLGKKMTLPRDDRVPTMHAKRPRK